MMSAIRKAVFLTMMLGLLGVSGCGLGDLLSEKSTPTPSVPDFHHLVPDAWTTEKVEEVDVDGDGEVEWLVIYRYDKSPRGFGGPLGGVIYDRQPDRSPQNLATPEPYRSSILVAYHLLPAIGGRGYLGENVGGEDKPWPELGEYDANGDGKEELVILGYSAPGFPTSLTIFRWIAKKDGYQGMIRAEVEGGGAEGAEVLWGDAGVKLEPDFEQGPIERVIVRRRLYHPYWYLRSQLGRRLVYEWNADQTKLEEKSRCIDFVFGRPGGASESGKSTYPVTYPEAAVLAYYEQGQVQKIREITILQGDKGRVHVTVEVIVDGQSLDHTCELTRKSTGKVKDVTRWEVSCPE